MSRKALLFAAAVAAQVLILAAMPLSKAYTRATGRVVILKVAPVDPYTILSGYYVRLGYDISRPESFPNVRSGPEPGVVYIAVMKGTDGEVLARIPRGSEVYAVVEKQADGTWHPVTLAGGKPDILSEGQAYLHGHVSGRGIEYGIEEFYIPEGKRDVIENDLRENVSQARVEVKVDSRGNAALVRLMIGDRVYE